MTDADPQRPDGVAAAFAPAKIDPSAQPSGSSARGASSTRELTYDLFFFGTLIHPSILAKVIGNAGSHVTAQPAILPGYAVHHVKGEDYPGLVRQDISDQIIAKGAAAGEQGADESSSSGTARAVRGTLVRGLRPEEVRRLDAFEGDEYRRAGVNVLPDGDIPALRNDERPRDASIGQFLAPLTSERIEALVAQSALLQRGSGAEMGVFANVYLWDAPPLETLAPPMWSFESFTASGKDRRWWSS